MEYTRFNQEMDALALMIKDGEDSFKIYIRSSILLDNGLQPLQHDINYYKEFIDKNIQQIIQNVKDGKYSQRLGGYDIDRMN